MVRSPKLETFFFGLVPATSLALLRIVVGAITLIWSVTLLFQIDPLLTRLRVDAVRDIGWWQFWPTAPESLVVSLVVGLILASVFMTLGLWTKAASWAAFVLTLVIQRYNPFAFNGGDFILRSVLLLGLALAPAGVYLSVDSWRRSRSIVWEAPMVSAWTLRFIQLHISMGYILTVLLKLQGDTWLGGTALWYAFSLDGLTRFDVPTWVVTPPIGALLGWATLAVELGVGIGVWFRKTRPYVLVTGVIFHLAIAAAFEIGFFSYVMLASYLVFLPHHRDVRMLPRRVVLEPV
jgi:Vitamin K-dependent gamma-carboxylase